MTKMLYVKYKCQECGAEDTDKLFENESPLPIINCYKCHSGFHVDVGMMAMQGKGMTIQGKPTTQPQHTTR